MGHSNRNKTQKPKKQKLKLQLQLISILWPLPPLPQLRLLYIPIEYRICMYVLQKKKKKNCVLCVCRIDRVAEFSMRFQFPCGVSLQKP